MRGSQLIYLAVGASRRSLPFEPLHQPWQVRHEWTKRPYLIYPVLSTDAVLLAISRKAQEYFRLGEFQHWKLEHYQTHAAVINLARNLELCCWYYPRVKGYGPTIRPFIDGDLSKGEKGWLGCEEWPDGTVVARFRFLGIGLS